ncbi:hypothetical protein, variant [Exophiala sideris]|uniref:PH domain-containing protein n=1 Tax=Exophiala sideris TaxID=1016849 RepID=A0A0D1YFV7_9EURO|nr:hypothetical protein, variant [Exophiala sideris]
MGKRTLTMRLNIYELFAYGLCKILLRQSHNRDHIDNLRHQIFDLQTQQLHGRRLIALTENFNTLSLVPVQQAGAHILPAMMRPPSTSSQDSWETVQRPAAPSPPGSSPTTTFSTTSHASSAKSDTTHWARKIFADLPATMLDDDPKTSSSYEGARTSSLPGPGYEKIIQIKFPSDFRIQLHWRSSDHRCKIVCEWPEGRRSMGKSCMPLDELHIRRAGPLLYLCYPTVVSTHTCWAILKFTSYEMLIIFHCTFLSLRSHDSVRHASNDPDYELKGESEEFAG